MNNSDLDFEQMRDTALRQLRSGESLYGKDGAFAPLLKQFLESALEGELDAHLDEGERSSGNRRNGKQRKTVHTSSGPIELETSRDRSSSFEPQLIRKRETVLADSLEKQILGMYGLGKDTGIPGVSRDRLQTGPGRYPAAPGLRFPAAQRRL